MTVFYARWLEEYQTFECSSVFVPCYKCGQATVCSCKLCGVYVCGDCGTWDEYDDDAVCLICVSHRCAQGVHFHHAQWQYGPE